jgi:hypothetical protein
MMVWLPQKTDLSTCPKSALVWYIKTKLLRYVINIDEVVTNLLDRQVDTYVGSDLCRNRSLLPLLGLIEVPNS